MLSASPAATIRFLLVRLASYLGLLALSALLAATLMRIAPGFGIEEQVLDPRWSESSRRQLSGDGRPDLLAFYAGYLGGLLHGELGQSTSTSTPVAELLRDRIPLTAGLLARALAAAWGLALLAALTAAALRRSWFDMSLAFLAGLLLCLPAALCALGALLAQWPPAAALTAILVPKLYSYSRTLLGEVESRPHVFAARARGLSANRILFRYVLAPAVPQFLALAGISVSLALAAAVPVEAFCDLPGIGQLAWKAALSRDLPVLVNLTVLVTAVTLAANTLADALTTLAQPGAPQ